MTENPFARFAEPRGQQPRQRFREENGQLVPDPMGSFEADEQGNVQPIEHMNEPVSGMGRPSAPGMTADVVYIPNEDRPALNIPLDPGADNPFEEFSQPAPPDPSITSSVGAFARGVTDFVPFLDEAAAALIAAPIRTLRDGGSYADNYTNTLRVMERQKEADDTYHNTAQTLGQVGGAATALVPISALGRAVQGKNFLNTTIRSTAIGAPIGAAATYAANPVDNRMANVGAGAVIGGATGLAAPAVGRIVGETARRVDQRLGISDGARRAWARLRGTDDLSGIARIDDESAIAALGTRTTQDPVAMRERAERFRAAGHEPALVNVTDESGRGMIAAMARRPGPGRETAQRAAEARALDLPDRLDRNMQTVIEGEAADAAQAAGRPASQAAQLRREVNRPLDETIGDLTEQRSAEMETAMEPIRAQPVPIDDDIVQVLNTQEGRLAIGRAMRTVTDADTREIMRRLPNTLQQVAGMNPAIQRQVMEQSGGLTVDIADRISRKLYAMAQNAESDAAPVLRDFARVLRNSARQASPDYDAALNQYAAASRRIDAAETGQEFLRPNRADEFKQRATDLDDALNTRQQELSGTLEVTGEMSNGTNRAARIRYTTQEGEDIVGSLEFSPDGKAAEISIIGGDGTYSTENIGRAGIANIREAGEAIRRQWPELENLVGFRITGARNQANRELEGLNAPQLISRYRDKLQEEFQRLYPDQPVEAFNRWLVGRNRQELIDVLDQMGITPQTGGTQVFSTSVNQRRFEDVGPSERLTAQMGARRAVQRASGENPASAPGVARRIAHSPEQHTRNNSLFTPQRAEQLEEMMAISAEDISNFAQIAPRTGSATAIRGVDDDALGGILAGAVDASRGNWGQATMRVLRSLGVRDQDVARIVEMAVDPARTDEIINMLERYLGNRQQAERVVNTLGIGTTNIESGNLAVQ